MFGNDGPSDTVGNQPGRGFQRFIDRDMDMALGEDQETPPPRMIEVPDKVLIDAVLNARVYIAKISPKEFRVAFQGSGGEQLEISMHPQIAVIMAYAVRGVMRHITQDAAAIVPPLATESTPFETLTDALSGVSRPAQLTAAEIDTLFMKELEWRAFAQASDHLLEETGLMQKLIGRPGQAIAEGESSMLFPIYVVPELSPEEQTHFIARQVADRLRQLLSEGGVRTVRDMMLWSQWMPEIQKAKPEDEQGILGLCKSVHIKKSQLKKMISPNATLRKAAIQALQKRPGFLYRPRLQEIREAQRKGNIFIIREPYDKSIAAFYSVLTDTGTVQRHLVEELGFDAICGYGSAKDLPGTQPRSKTLQTGERVIRTIKWMNEHFALQTFQKARAGKLACGIDIAVSPNTDPSKKVLRGAEVATALKIAAYKKLQEDGIEDLMLKLFEIFAVNGIPLDYPVWNLPSLRLNETLGARRMAQVEERWRRKDGLTLTVNWHYLVNPISDALQWAEEHHVS